MHARPARVPKALDVRQGRVLKVRRGHRRLARRRLVPKVLGRPAHGPRALAPAATTVVAVAVVAVVPAVRALPRVKA